MKMVRVLVFIHNLPIYRLAEYLVVLRFKGYYVRALHRQVDLIDV